MENFKTCHAGGLSRSREKGTKVMLAGRMAFLPNERVPIVVQTLTEQQIAEIPRDKYAVTIVETEPASTGHLASSTSIVSPLTRRHMSRYRNLIRRKGRVRPSTGPSRAGGAKVYVTIITLLHQLLTQAENLYYTNRELRRENMTTPPPGSGIFLAPVDEGKMSDCINEIILKVFGDGDKGKVLNREIKLAEFCLLMHRYFIYIKILGNTARQPFSEYLENYVFEGEPRFTAKTFNNYANNEQYKELDLLLNRMDSQAPRSQKEKGEPGINFKYLPEATGKLQDAFQVIGHFFHNSPYFDELRKIQENVAKFKIKP